jgi:membrane protease subunit HflK
MNWDWDKLQQNRRGSGGGGEMPRPNFDNWGQNLQKFKNFKFPAGKLAIGLVVLLWLASGIYIVEPAEVGVVMRFGAYHRMTEPGPHYHFPFPIESVETPKVAQIRRLEIGFRSLGRESQFQSGQFRLVPEEALMLTGDENIVDVQFIVQYQIRDPKDYLFNVHEQAATVKNAAEAAMREVIGDNKIDTALTGGKMEIQTQTQDLLQEILDRYAAGLRVVAVQLQDVHPPKEVVDAFKDVASAREDRSRIINEAEAYRNDILPKARGRAAEIVNEAQAYEEKRVRQAKGDSNRFLAVLREYEKAEEVTRERLFLEAMESIFSNPDLEKVIISETAKSQVLPYLPLDRMKGSKQGGGQ